MGSLMKKQAERFLREKKRHRRWLAMFLCLALVVTSGTFAALRMNGHAMDHGGKILNCRLRVHEHTDECYDSDGKLICGQADYVVHTHDGRCRNEEGELVCQLPEREAHVHDSSCYAEEKVLTCKEEETAGHQHSPECYIEEQGELVCTLPEHEHSDACYDETGNLICGQEAHVHDGSCYAVNEVLACGQEEGQGGHTHTDACYETQKKLICGELELHTHDKEKCYDVNGNLTCGKLELEEHEHGEGCFEDEEAAEIDLENEEFLASGDPEENKPEESVSDNAKDPSEEQAAENIVSSDSVSEDAISDNSLSENAVSENSVSENTVSDNSVSENSVSENSVSDNSVSENSVSENIISLSANVGGTTITLSGPESSFEKDKEYSIQAEEIISLKKANEQAAQAEENEEVKANEQLEPDEKDEKAEDNGKLEPTKEAKDDKQTKADKKDEESEDDEQIKAIKEAVDKLAEEKEKEVKDYQAFDITLLADGKEVQPLGPVEVKFSGKKVEKAVENEKTDVEVLHVGEDTGKPQDAKTAVAEEKKVEIETEGYSAQDMKATATEEKEVVIETEHFSVYVWVNLEHLRDTLEVHIEHWGKGIKTISGNADAEKGTDTVYVVSNKESEVPKTEINTKEMNTKIYSDDDLKIPNQHYMNITELSKVCNVGLSKMNYELDSVEIIEKGETEGTTYTKEEVSTKPPKHDITITKDATIRFYYTPKTGDNKLNVSANFYDYYFSDGVKTGNKLHTDRMGINADKYYKEGENDRLGIGQPSTGNYSSWADSSKYNGKKLNSGNPSASGVGGAGIVKDIVGNLDAPDGNLQFKVNAPNCLFKEAKGASKKYSYTLGFKQSGDTFTLQYVNDGNTKRTGDLTKFIPRKFRQWNGKGAFRKWICSNDFWPLDGLSKVDPDLGGSQAYTFQKKNSSGQWIDGEKDNDNDDNYDFDAQRYTGTKAHNWYFGMTYSVDFTVGDYVGPMEYYFRGDDDFWLFVDGQKVVDIGGVHTSVGHSFNLREWMEQKGWLDTEEKREKKHTLKVFYMERGATGSCCYMQFTLPQSEPVDIPVMPVTDYSVQKVWKNDGNNKNGFRPTEIKVNLLKDGEPTDEMMVLNESNDWKYTWHELPKENRKAGKDIVYNYTVKEVNLPPGYISSLGDDGKTLTNTLIPIKVKVKKVWQNDDEFTKYRPDVMLQLYANNKKYIGEDGQPRTITLNAKNEWEGEFDNLPEYYDYKLKDDGSYSAKKVVYSVKEVGAETSEDGNEYLTTKDGVQYKVTYDRKDYNLEPTVTPPTSSAPNKAPAYTGPSQEMPGLDEAVPDEIERDEEGEGDTGEIEEDDEESSDQAVVDDGAADDSGNGEIAAEPEADAEGYEEGFSEETTAMNAAATFDAASYDMAGVAPAAEVNTAPPAADGIAAELTVTNTLVKNFKIVKKSSNKETPDPLQGAEFTLTPCNADGTAVGGEAQTITSGADGIITLDWDKLQKDNYYLMAETKAPAGYMLSRTRWIIQIVENFGMKEIGEVKSFEDYTDLDSSSVPGAGGTSKPISVNYTPETNDSNELVLTYTFKNDELYELPSTGGIGTYWYTISGMLLMMGASLILYKNRRRQAVRR